MRSHILYRRIYVQIYIYINFICKCDKIRLIVINFDYVVSIHRVFKLQYKSLIKILNGRVLFIWWEIQGYVCINIFQGFCVHLLHKLKLLCIIVIFCCLGIRKWLQLHWKGKSMKATIKKSNEFPTFS